MQALSFEGEKGTKVVRGPIPSDLVDQAKAVRAELIEKLADVDDEIAELFVAEEEPTTEQIRAGAVT